ncbi:kynurenine--oxoglutarate transaminase 1-like [Lineus longissimus]|uniref:kynurenine--oxoglutarate transaminase 1-like n=1 Tax=Lineus longissimus TaxID=88925 RepID=UPI00315CF2F2
MRDTVMELERMCSGDSAISLLVGFPDYSPPENLVEYIKDTVSGKNIILNQYCTTTNGHLPLLEAFADLYSPKFNRTLHPLKNIATSIGATGALMKLFRSFTLPGDEIILFEPYYTLFYHMMQDTSGATAVTVPLHLNRSPNAVPPTSADFTFDPEELEAAFTEKTKMLLCNTPHNPTGKKISGL